LCHAELQLCSDNPVRQARLSFELGIAADDPVEALKYFQQALALHADHLPSIQHARELLLERRNVKEAAALFDAEIRLAAEPAERARIHHLKGRAFEDVGREPAMARSCYKRATELDPAHPSYLRALQQLEGQAEAWEALARSRQGEANAVRQDPSYRAALLVARARLLEARLGRVDEAIELYEQALALDPAAAGALRALKRLLHDGARWRELIDVLQREAAATSDPRISTLALFRIGRIYRERLGSRAEAIEALTRAAQISADDRLVLAELAQLHQEAGEPQQLANVLAQEVEAVGPTGEQVALLARIGGLYENELGHPDSARAWYEAALRIDPTFGPVVQALDGLYVGAEAHEALIGMYQGVAEQSTDTQLRADAHARIATIFELHLARPQDAVLHHGKALGLDPSKEASLKALLRIHAKQGQHRELCDLLGRAVERSGDEEVRIAYLLKIGAICEDHLGEPVQAVQAYRRILERHPEHLGAIHALQRAAETACRHSELVEALDMEVALCSEPARCVAVAHRAATIVAGQLGDRDAALARFKQVLQIDPRYGPVLASLGRLYHQLGRFEDVLGIHRRQLEILPKGPGQVSLLHSMGALCEHQLRRDEEAIVHYRRAISLDPTHGPSLRALSRQLRRRSDFKGLVGVLQSALLGTKNSAAIARAAFRLGEVYEVHLEELDRAVGAYQQAVSAEPGYRPAVDGLARVRARQQAWLQLVAELNAEAESNSERSLVIAALLRAGEIYVDRLGQPQRAIACYEAVRTQDSNNPAALLALEPLYARAGSWEQLVGVLAAQAASLQDPAARIAALEEQARLQLTRGVGDEAALRETLMSILEIEPAHRGALAGLERAATETNELSLLADIQARLAAVQRDPHVAAVHFVRLGSALEASDPQAAQTAYRSALEHCAESVSAIRGLRRTAEQCGDVRALIEAYHREASWTRDGVHAAELLARCAQLRVEQLADTAAAIEDAIRALERSADHLEAARLLIALLSESEQWQRLIEQLSLAASSAQQRSRIAWLWREVARLYADRKQDLSAAISVLEQMREQHGDDVDSAYAIGVLHARNRQWSEAVAAFGRALQLKPEGPALVRLELERGRLLAERLDDTKAAAASLERVLVLEPRHPEALSLLLDVCVREERFGRARALGKALVEIATGPEEHAAALIEVARIEVESGQPRLAAEALRMAVTLQGAMGPAAAEYKKLLGADEPWEHYAEALEQHLLKLKSGECEGELKPNYLALARIQYEVLTEVDASVRTLRKGLKACEGDVELQLELGERLSTAGRGAAAVTTLTKLVAREPIEGRAWRTMARTLHNDGRSLEAGVMCAALVVLAEATEIEKGLAGQKRLHPGWARPQSFDAEALLTLSVAPDATEERRIVELLVAMSEATSKAYAPDFDSYGVSSRDRLSERSEHPLRALSDRLAKAFGVPAYELYVHGSSTSEVVAELSLPVSIMVPRFVLDLNPAQQVFMVARAFATVASGVHIVPTLGRRRTGLAFAAVMRQVVERYGAGRYPEQELAKEHKRLAKAVPRRSRKLVQAAASLCLNEPMVDFERWANSVELSSARAAALITNDLPEVAELLSRSAATTASLKGATLVRSSALIADLMRFWASPAAFDVRRSAGII